MFKMSKKYYFWRFKSYPGEGTSTNTYQLQRKRELSRAVLTRTCFTRLQSDSFRRRVDPPAVIVTIIS